jgi:hypothetical protein
MTFPEGFAMRGGWLDPGSAELFARYCGPVMDRARLAAGKSGDMREGPG